MRNNFKKSDYILVLTPAVVGVFVLLFALCFLLLIFDFLFPNIKFVADVMK